MHYTYRGVGLYWRKTQPITWRLVNEAAHGTGGFACLVVVFVYSVFYSVFCLPKLFIGLGLAAGLWAGA